MTVFDNMANAPSAIVPAPSTNSPRQTTGGAPYDGMQLVIRPQRKFATGDRSGHFDTFFGHYIDRVQDPSRAKAKDPDIQNRMRQDLQVLGSMNVRKLSTSQLRRQWVPSPHDFGGVIAKKFEGWFDGQYRVTEALMNMLEAILDGISIQEILWSRPSSANGYSFGIERMFNCYKDRFLFTKDGKLCLKTRSNLFYGEQVHPWQFIVHQYGSSGGSWSQPNDEGRLYWGRGLEDNIYPTYFFKTATLNLYTRWLQRLSGGVFIGRYPHNESGAQAKIMDIMSAWQEDEAFAIPAGEEWAYDIHEGSKVAADTFLMAIEYFDKNMAKAILGATLINDQPQTGSFALGEVQTRNTFAQICSFDRTGVEETVNKSIVTPLGELNHVPAHLRPKMKFCLDPDQRGGPLLEDLLKLQQLGFTVTAEMVSETTGYKQPGPGETVLTAKADPMTGAFGGMNQQNGQGSPMSNVDVSSPEGLKKFQAAIAKVGAGRVGEYLAETRAEKVVSYAADGDGHWVTIGGEKGADGSNHGGSPVFIGGDGTIRKGPSGVVGRKIGELGQKKTADKPAKPESDFNRAMREDGEKKDAAPSPSRAQTGIFGQPEYFPQGNTQNEMFDTSNPAERPESDTDAKIRAKNNPKDTAEMDFTAEKPKGQKRPRAWSKASIERQLVEAHKSEGSGEEFDTLRQEATEAAGSGNAFTFTGKLPTEVKEFIMEGRRHLLKFVSVSGDTRAAGGADAFGAMGDRYLDLLESMGGGSTRLALASARKSQDPEVKFLADVYDNLDSSAPLEEVKPDALEPGDSFELGGEEITVDSDRVMRDGTEFSPTPVDWLKNVPVDPGTLRKSPAPF